MINAIGIAFCYLLAGLIVLTIMYGAFALQKMVVAEEMRKDAIKRKCMAMKGEHTRCYVGKRIVR